MIHVQDVALSFGGRALFKEVNAKFVPGNCYGLIGANGAGKSTFLKILSGVVEPTEGQVHIEPGKRIAVLQQDQFAFDEHRVLDTVMMGHKQLFAIMQEREELYSKTEMTEEEGVRIGTIEDEFAELGGYEAEAEAATLLDGLGIYTDLHDKMMSELEGSQKVRVLLSQALFGNPDILLLDEPTNQLDIKSIQWLEEFLFNFDNTVIVVSHDRHFLNNVCTHIADVDFRQIKVYVGNYDFWFEASQIVRQQRQNENKKKADKVKELKAFIQRFGSNASKARQATSRKKLLEKLDIEDLPASSRRFPYVDFKPERSSGRMLLKIEGLTKRIDGELVLDNFDLTVRKDDKIAFIGPNGLAKTILFEIIMGKMEPDEGVVEWGTTITPAYLPKDNETFFENDLSLIQWLLQYAPPGEGEQFARSFLGRMLFNGDEATKKSRVLSGGEKVRCMLSKMMLSGANFLVMDEPTNHLDLESITALNNGLMKFPEVVLFSSHDYQFIDTVATRIIEFADRGVIEREMRLSDYVKDEATQVLRQELYQGRNNVQL